MPNSQLTKLKKGQAFFLRQNPDYHLNELRLNTFRRIKYKYDDKRRDEIYRFHRKRRETNKGLLPRMWTDKEKEFLIRNYAKKEYKEIAKKLDRSTGSIEHKVLRIGLLKNHKWQILKTAQYPR